VQLIVCAKHKIQHFGMTVTESANVVRLCLFVKIDFEDALACQFIPHVNLLLVVTDEGLGVRVV